MLAATAVSGATVCENVAYYDVSGKTAKAILDDLARKAPPPGFGGAVAYFARAETYFRWGFDYSTEGGGCRIESYDVNVDIERLIPRWSDRAAARKTARLLGPIHRAPLGP